MELYHPLKRGYVGESQAQTSDEMSTAKVTAGSPSSSLSEWLGSAVKPTALLLGRIIT